MPYVKVMLPRRQRRPRRRSRPVSPRASETSGSDARLIELDLSNAAAKTKPSAPAPARVWNRVAPPSEGSSLSSIEKDSGA